MLSKDACTFPRRLFYTDGNNLTFALNETQTYNVNIPYYFPAKTIVCAGNDRILLLLSDYTKWTMIVTFEMKTLSFKVTAKGNTIHFHLNDAIPEHYLIC